jgi:hypothetical protein
MEVEKKFLVLEHFSTPGGVINPLQLLKALSREVQSRPVDVFVRRLPAEGSFFRQGASTHPINDPFKNAHVLTKPGPQEFAVGILTEPVHIEHARRFAKRALHVDPVTKIVTHVVTAEWQHRHRIAPDFSEDARCGGGHFEAHRCAKINARAPIESLIDQGKSARATSAKD